MATNNSNLNALGGRLKRPLSAATQAMQRNGCGAELVNDDGEVYLTSQTMVDWDKGYTADKAKRHNTYHAVQKYDLGDPDAIKRKDGAQLVEVKTAYKFATPDYLATKAQDAITKRWRNLATAIKNGLLDESGKGLTLDDVANWQLGQRDDRKWLFKRFDGKGVVFCGENDKGAVRWEDVPDAQKKTIHRHVAAAKRAKGIAVEDAPVDINSKIASLEQLLQTHYSDEALAGIGGGYREHLLEFKAAKEKELERLKKQRDKKAKDTVTKTVGKRSNGAK